MLVTLQIKTHYINDNNHSYTKQTTLNNSYNDDTNTNNTLQYIYIIITPQ